MSSHDFRLIHVYHHTGSAPAATAEEAAPDSSTGDGYGGDIPATAAAVESWMGRLVKSRENARSMGRKQPNIVVFVVESVGSKQLFSLPGGVADPKVSAPIIIMESGGGHVKGRGY